MFNCMPARLHACWASRQIRKKIQGMELSVIQDLHMLREDMAKTNEKLERFFEMQNESSKLPLRMEDIEALMNGASEGAANGNYLKLEQTVLKELRRIKRAFVTQKMHLTKVQSFQNAKLDRKVNTIIRAVNNMTNQVNDMVNDSYTYINESGIAHKQHVGKQLDAIEDEVNKSLTRIEAGLNASLLLYAEEQKHQNSEINNIAEIMKGTFNNSVQLIKALLNEGMHGIQNKVEKSVISFQKGQTKLEERMTTTLLELSNDYENLKDSIYCLQMEGRIRLVNGPNRYSGRLEVFLNCQWGTVCDDEFGVVDGNVVCRMIRGEFTIVEVKSAAYFGRGSGPILLDNMACTGEEKNLLDCGKDLDTTDCHHGEDVGVICR